jgi:hypothetical protein
MTNNDHVPIPSQSIAIDNLPSFDSPDRRSLWGSNVDTIMKIRASRSETRVNRSVHGPDKSFKVLPRFDGFRCLWPGGERFCWRDDLNRQLSRRSGDKDPLTYTDLTCVFDAIDPSQFFVAHIVGFADAKQILTRSDHVVGALRLLGWRS